MAAHPIEYIWKINRPKDERIARALMVAAYKTAIETDPNTTKVLIRSGIHDSTRVMGKYVKDRAHITVSVKNAQTTLSRQHMTSHGYTAHMRSFDVISVEPSGNLNSDTDDTWPASMETKPKDTVTGPPELPGTGDNSPLERDGQ